MTEGMVAAADATRAALHAAADKDFRFSGNKYYLRTRIIQNLSVL
jgi:hypothetical protein